MTGFPLGGRAPRLTVLLVTFNHERYVRQACESIIRQRLDEPFQVIVADDASTDATRQVIAETFARAGERAPPVRFLDHAETLGITRNYLRGFAACDTEHVAILEGDDFWIHPEKLARQLDFLDHHWECAAVSANHFVYDERTSQYTARTQAGDGHSYLDARMLIQSNIIGNFSTCMYRTDALRNMPEQMFKGTVYDWGVNLCVGRNALIGFLHTPLSVYRLHAGGAWSGLSQAEQIQAQLRVIDHYNNALDRVFDAEFRALRKTLQAAPGLSPRHRPWLPRIGAILLACLPPFIPAALGWLGRSLAAQAVPPIIPICIRKLRRRRQARS